MSESDVFNPWLPGSGPRGCIAAVDLGSNTFHLLVARIDAGEPRTIARLRFRVRLAAGLDAEGRLDERTLAAARDALLRIADRLGGLPPEQIRVVGTSALRCLADPGPFAAMVQTLLGVPLSVIDGAEEAHLVFAGAAETLPERTDPRLVIDIGGGSTEFALGHGHVAQHVASVPLGCVAVSRDALVAGTDGAGVMARALAHARAALADVDPEQFRAGADVEAIGTSGSFEAVRSVLSARGWCDGPVTREALERLVAALAREPSLPIGLPGLEEDREDLFHGGLAILLAAMERLDIQRIDWAEGALQDGLVRRIVPLPEDGLRAATLRALCSRFVVDPLGAQRVRDVALRLADAAAAAVDLPSADRVVLEAGALLHDVGMAVNARHHERHGATLIRHAELRGFASDERLLIEHLVRGHRGPWPRLPQAALPPPLRPRAERLCVLLRLAVVLAPVGVDALPDLGTAPGELRIAVDARWRDAHPWIMDRLRAECALLASAGARPRPLVGARVPT